MSGLPRFHANYWHDGGLSGHGACLLGAASPQRSDVPSTPPIPADFNNDGDVDQNNVDAFEACASGPDIPLTPDCEGKDFDNDNDTDQSDFGIVQRCLSGEDNPADPTCAD